MSTTEQTIIAILREEERRRLANLPPLTTEEARALIVMPPVPVSRPSAEIAPLSRAIDRRVPAQTPSTQRCIRLIKRRDGSVTPCDKPLDPHSNWNAPVCRYCATKTNAGAAMAGIPTWREREAAEEAHMADLLDQGRVIAEQLSNIGGPPVNVPLHQARSNTERLWEQRSVDRMTTVCPLGGKSYVKTESPIGIAARKVLSLVSLCVLRWAQSEPSSIPLLRRDQLPLPPEGLVPSELHELLRWVSDKTRKYLLDQLKDSSSLVHLGKLQELQWLDRYFTLGKTDKLVHQACTSNQLETAQWLVERVGIPKREECITTFHLCLDLGLMAIAKWLSSLHDLSSESLTSEEIDHATKQVGDIQWLMATFNSQVDSFHRIDVKGPFIKACEEGQLEQAQWLVGVWDLKVDLIHARHGLAFRQACHHGHLAVAQWIVEQCGFPDIFLEDLFRTVCRHGHLPVAQWLASSLTVDNIKGSNALRVACQHNHLLLARWLVETFRLTVDDVRVEVESALINACRNMNKALARWLIDTFQLNNDHIQNARSRALTLANPQKQPAIAKWIANLMATDGPMTAQLRPGNDIATATAQGLSPSEP